MPLQAYSPEGKPIDPQTGITPIFVELEPGLYQIIGTGFYIARYGLFITAKHVVDDILEHDREDRPIFTWSWDIDGGLRFRPVLTCNYFNEAPRGAADIAVCQTVDAVEDGEVRFGNPNERIAIVTTQYPLETHIATYAYPDNYQVDCRNRSVAGEVFADSFDGSILEMLGPTEGFLRYPHISTSMEIRSGASGGPVFGLDGHAFAVNCRGWNLHSSINESPLSSIVPLSLILDLEFPCPHMPRGSGEERTTPADRLNTKVTLRDLATWGHISLNPPPSPHQ